MWMLVHTVNIAHSTLKTSLIVAALHFRSLRWNWKKNIFAQSKEHFTMPHQTTNKSSDCHKLKPWCFPWISIWNQNNLHCLRLVTQCSSLLLSLWMLLPNLRWHKIQLTFSIHPFLCLFAGNSCDQWHYGTHICLFVLLSIRQYIS